LQNLFIFLFSSRCFIIILCVSQKHEKITQEIKRDEEEVKRVIASTLNILIILSLYKCFNIIEKKGAPLCTLYINAIYIFAVIARENNNKGIFFNL
jgi:hypothetical protein